MMSESRRDPQIDEIDDPEIYKGTPELDEGDPHYVDDDLYARLTTQRLASCSRFERSENAQIESVTPFLFWEARLLDTKQYRKWLSLLTRDCIYWVPANYDAGDPRQECGINFDDRRRLIDRIVLIETGALHAQTPPSRTCRLIGNIESWPANDGSVQIRSNLVLWERRVRRTTCYVGWQDHELIPNGDGWLIRRKVINLINCDEPQGNVSFII